MRRFRLVSLGGLDIGVKGLNGSSLLDTLLMDNPHKVATISIPFNDKIVLEFVKSLMNPGKEISRDAAKRIGAVYKLLGADIGVEFDESEIAEKRATYNVATNAELSKNAMEIEPEETKYIIKIEVEHQLVTNHASVEDISSNGDISVAIETSIDNGENQPDMTNDNDNQDVQNNYVVDDNDPQEPDVNASTKSSDLVMQDNGEDTCNSNDNYEHGQDQPLDTEEVDCYENYSEADFSFHDLEEDRARELSYFEFNDASNITEMTNTATSTVVRNILKTSQSHNVTHGHIHIPNIMSDIQYSKFPDALRLRFVKRAVFPIRDITRKRKRKRGH